MIWAIAVKRARTRRETQRRLQAAILKLQADMIESSDKEVNAFFAQVPVGSHIVLSFGPEKSLAIGRIDT